MWESAFSLSIFPPPVFWGWPIKRGPESVEEFGLGLLHALGGGGGSLAEFLSKSPLAGSGLKVCRLGFLAGQMSIPDDFDLMGSADIEDMFDGED